MTRPRRRGYRFFATIAIGLIVASLVGTAVIHVGESGQVPSLLGDRTPMRISKPLVLPGALRESTNPVGNDNVVRFPSGDPNPGSAQRSQAIARPVSLFSPAHGDGERNPGNEIQAALNAALTSPGVREALAIPDKADFVGSTREQGTPPALAAPAPANEVPTKTESAFHERVTVREGEALYHIFKRLQLSQSDLLAIAGKKGVDKALRQLRPGIRIEFFADSNGNVEKLLYQKSAKRRVLIERTDKGFRRREVEVPITDAESSPAKKQANMVSATRPPEELRRIKVTIRDGDSMYLLFQAHRVSTQDLATLLESARTARTLKRISPGQLIEFFVTEANSLAKLLYHPDGMESIEFVRNEDGAYSRRTITHSLTAKQVSATGTIESSLFVAGQRAGLSDRLIMQLAEIFGWDVDFVLDIRRGDRFSVIYEELYRNGLKVRNGSIVAAEFVNRGRSIRALRYQGKDGRGQYFSPEGLSMRKAFLRSPVDFARISSRFSFARRHPILHKIRAHKGVDYAAAHGTPVRASGDGKVTFAGHKGGYGRTVILQHGSTYTTLYAHLHRFAKGARTGKRVRQGQVIGYVGSSGLATGPHLHYEFRVRGVHRDPLKVKLPQAAPIDEKLRQDFINRTAGLLAKLDTLSQRVVAVRP